MVFNSIEFIGFILPVGFIFFLLNRPNLIRLRNLFLLVASWYFYASFGWEWLGLLIYVIVVNYFGAIAVSKYFSNRKLYISSTIILSLITLVMMKYAYLVDSSIILPVGLSFFTFQALAYSIDVYRNKVEAESDLIKVALYVSFLPTVLSGPIERARNLFPQLSAKTPMNYDHILSGVRLFVWGVLKKVVIADRLALYVDSVYGNPMAHSGTTLALAAFFYSVQIYCDFSGYADMAIGVGRSLGFSIMENFSYPYFATSIKEFWRRWHISLTSWFTEYVYISLGGNRVSALRWIFNIIAIFLLSGIWHGATMGFIIWGGIHAAAYLIEYYLKLNKGNFFYGLICFFVVTIAWIYFRIPDSGLATSIVGKIFTDFTSPAVTSIDGSAFSFYITLAMLLLFIIREVIEYRYRFNSSVIINAECVFSLIVVALFGVSTSQFVYFQF